MANAHASSIDPIAILAAHQEARERGTRLVSAICGAPGVGRGLWGRWLTGDDEHRVSSRWVTAVGPTLADAHRALAFSEANQGAPLMFAPAAHDFPQALAGAVALAGECPQRPVAIVVEPAAVMDLLQANGADEDQAPLRMALIGGLVVLDQHVETVLNRSVLRGNERPLYRSTQEQVLHKLLEHDRAIEVEFVTNHRVRGATGKAYEVDLWCKERRFALEVDGGQHVSNAAQKQKDAARDSDLAQTGVETLRVHASEVMSDPTSVLRYVRGRLKARD